MKRKAAVKRPRSTFAIEQVALNDIVSQFERQIEEIAALKDELKQTRAELNVQVDRLDGLRRILPMVVIILDRRGIIQECHDRENGILGDIELKVGQPFVRLLSLASIRHFGEKLIECITSVFPVNFEATLRARGRSHPVEISMLRRHSSGQSSFLVTITDRAESAQILAELESASQRWLSLVKSAPDIIMVLEADGLIVSTNRPWLCDPGSSNVGKGILEYLPASQHLALKRCMVSTLRNGTVMGSEVNFPDRPNKPWFHLLFSPMFVDNIPATTPGRICLTIRDVTAGKQLELERQRTTAILRALSAKDDEIRDKERMRIAREIHDELGQSLTVLKMDLSYMRAHGRLDGAVAERAKAMDESIDTTIDSIRRITYELRPPMLDLGLIPAIEWQVRNLEKRTGIRCSMKIKGRKLHLDETVGASVFRIVQETLTNIARHSGAGQVDFVMAMDKTGLRLRIRDNGRGIRKEDLENPSLGLTGMRERVHHIGGQFQIESAIGGGTQVSVYLPAKRYIEEKFT